MSGDRAGVTEKSRTREFARQQEVEEFVKRLIAVHGYYVAIDELLCALNNLAEASMTDPQTSWREFTAWVEAVRAAVIRHSEGDTFEQLVNDADSIRARGIGIRLD